MFRSTCSLQVSLWTETRSAVEASQGPGNPVDAPLGSEEAVAKSLSSGMVGEEALEYAADRLVVDLEAERDASMPAELLVCLEVSLEKHRPREEAGKALEHSECIQDSVACQ